jgi:hypothetical protein
MSEIQNSTSQLLFCERRENLVLVKKVFQAHISSVWCVITFWGLREVIIMAFLMQMHKKYEYLQEKKT